MHRSYEKFEDIKVAMYIQSCISKDRQHNVQNKKDIVSFKRTNNDL